jgi:hypothetical protein
VAARLSLRAEIARRLDRKGAARQTEQEQDDEDDDRTPRLEDPLACAFFRCDSGKS